MGDVGIVNARTIGYREFRSPLAFGYGDEGRTRPLDIFIGEVRAVVDAKFRGLCREGNTLLALAL